MIHRTGEHKSECFNPIRHSYSSRKYKHFRECGMERKDIHLVELEWGNTDNILDIEAKWINKLGSLNEKSSIFDTIKHKKRRLLYSKPKKCDCGGTWSSSQYKRHYNTKRHITWLEEENKKKLKYLDIINEQEYEESKKNHPKVIHLHFSENKKIFIKET